MKAVILAGGMGTRLSEETQKIPKPMVEIGGRPILWHIMKYYSSFGINDFIICCGYKGYMIKEYFYHYHMHNANMRIQIKNGDVSFLSCCEENWNVTVIDTGVETLTEGRLLQVKEFTGNDTFCLTYGDGLSDVNLKDLIKFHNDHKTTGSIATLTAVKTQGRFGALILKDNSVVSFNEKIISDDTWINGGFFVMEPSIFKYLHPECMLEQNSLVTLTSEGKLNAFPHAGNWRCMDTLHEKAVLEEMWKSGEAFWKREDKLECLR